MIGRLRGTLAEKQPPHLILDVNGVGYELEVPMTTLYRLPALGEAEFDMMYGEGISREGNVLDLAVEQGIVEKSGTWFSYHDQRIGQGRDNARMFLKENPKIAAEIETAVRSAVGLKPVGSGA